MKNNRRKSNFVLMAALFFILVLAQTGCATIINGKYQKIKINSKPDEAIVLITSSCNPGTFISVETPAEVKLKRDSMYHLKFTKEGYKPLTLGIGHKANKVTYLNILGIIPHSVLSAGTSGPYVGPAAIGTVFIIIDHILGTVWTLTPSEINAELQPETKP